MEFSVNLTKLGIEPANFSSNACGSPFRRVFIKTRASTSFTAELKDFIAPFRMFNYPMVDANAYLQYFCGTLPSTTINVYNPVDSYIYTWTTNNGSIVGATTGPAITVNAPGTYIVTQQLHNQCPGMSIDSITIIFDSICAVLNVNIAGLSASQKGNEVSLSWQSYHNELAGYYIIESSIDNSVFKEIGTIPANNIPGKADYAFRNQVNINDQVLFYRVKVVGKNGISKNSSSVLLKPINDTKNTLSIFPNPAQGEIWLMMESSITTKASVYISDITGRPIRISELQLKRGNNLVPLNQLKGQVDGMYLVRVKTPEGETTQKIILKK